MKSKIDKRRTAENIYRLISVSGIGNAELADILEVTTVAIWKWTNAKTLPSLENIAAMCLVFKCDISDIVVIERGGKSA